MKEKLKILFAEDDLNLGSLLSEFLKVKGYNVTHCLNGEDAFRAFSEKDFDLCILDIMMPKKDGITLTKDIRKTNSQIPIIFLTSKSLQEDKIEGFKAGADDYITKPFSNEELFLRISAILKRVNSSNDEFTEAAAYKIGNYSLDCNKRILTIGNEEVKLTSREADLLKLLAHNINKEVDRSQALRLIWKDDNYFTARSMDVYVEKLRKHLEKDDSVQILNIHGKGFKLLA